jgi:hypothetical protein
MFRIQAAAFAGAIALLVTLAPREGRCQRSGDYSLVYTAFYGLVAADAAFTGYDVYLAARGERASTGAAIGEIAVAAPQFVITGLVLSNQQSEVGWPTAYFAWTGVLTLHGILSLAVREGSRPPPGTPPDPPRPWERRLFTVAPTVLNDGMSTALAPGLSASGRF